MHILINFCNLEDINKAERNELAELVELLIQIWLES